MNTVKGAIIGYIAGFGLGTLVDSAFLPWKKLDVVQEGGPSAEAPSDSLSHIIDIMAEVSILGLLCVELNEYLPTDTEAVGILFLVGLFHNTDTLKKSSKTAGKELLRYMDGVIKGTLLKHQ